MATAAPARPRGPVPGYIFRCHLILLLVFNWMVPILTSELLTVVPESEICKSIDIRNRLESFNQLKDCKIIEGSLQILLFDNMNDTDFSHISFPKLTEITDYLLLFRVNGLKSVGQLFPNLAVIRGQNLVPGLKALVIFEMASLLEIGLHSLTDIMQGAVHIDKNPSLCFVNTIDWKKIVHDQSSHMYIKSLKPENECPVCPASVNGQDCPRNEDDEDKFLCWNRDYCQKLCKNCNGTCNANGTCCDDYCLGGCGDDTTKCSVCRHYALIDDASGSNKCVKNCPSGFYTYLGRRCITRNYCIQATGPLNPQSNDGEITNYKIFNDSCVLKCPTNYADDLNHSCKKCDNTCRKECPGARIDSINLAYELRGCTHITSSLEIQIRGGHKVVKVLEENLGMIEEIDGYLKVVRSFSLVSLNFFKNLKRINGRFLDSHKHSLVVLDNQNLQDLFDWGTHKDFKINNGSIFFHFNPKLCISKIEKLREVAGLPKLNEMEVAPDSNGDKVACNVTELIVTVHDIKSKSAILGWKPFEIDDSRKLLSYIVYRIEAPQQTVNFYDGRDACGQDNWHVDDVANTAENKFISHPLTNLKPYTQYAFYIKTYTIATEKYGAQSKISYFSTHPAQPSAPRQFEVTSNSSDSLLVKWKPPVDPNGKITHYIVSGIKHTIYTPTNRDYCKDAVTPTLQKKNTKLEVPRKLPKESCETPDEKNILKIYDEQEEINRINFENELHNKVYVKRTNHSRSTRSINLMFDKNSVNTSLDNDAFLQNFTEPGVENKTDSETDTWVSFSFTIYDGVEQFYIRNLHHYTSYEITVKACRETFAGDMELSCSEGLGQTATTMKKVGADNITNVTVSNITSDSITVHWVQPSEPNGMIVSVTILYKREGNKNAQYIGECISFMDFPHFSKDNKSMNYTITKLFPGNHSLCLKASSFAGIGDISECVNFIIPEGTSNAVVIISCILTSLLLVICACLYWFYRKTIKERNTMRLIPSVNPEYVSGVYVPDEWEVPRKKIEFIRELGQGSFGMVWEGIAYDIRGQPSVPCAVKTVNEHATNRERVDFLNEASVMKAFDTTHVVRLLGVVSQGQPTLVVMELMAQGDLKTYLRSHRPENNDRKSAPTLRQILQMAIEIADGMAYLEAKKFVHRDLAARNCMVSENLIVKIGDFGMTRDIYETDYYRKGSKGLLPVRWMAPESLKDGVFSSSSDVWSYGVVLWEMSTLASQPYQGLANDQVLRYVIEGGVMERPENCPDKLYDLMRCCWVNKPARRPTFMRLCQLLLPDSNDYFRAVSFYHSPAGNEARTARSAAMPNPEHVEHEVDGEDADASTPLNALPPDVRLARAFGMSASGQSDSGQSVQLDPNPRFYSISEERTANGFVANRTKNGKPQSQC